MRIFLFILTVFFISCQENNNNNNTIKIVSTIPDSVNSTYDLNFKADLIKYLNAMFEGNSDLAMSYIHPSIYQYFKNKYPEENIQESDIKEEFFKKPMKDQFRKQIDMGASIEFQIDSITQRIHHNNIDLFMAITHISTTVDMDKFSSGGKVIGISENNGENWRFIQYSGNASREVLLLLVPDYVIKELLVDEE